MCGEGYGGEILPTTSEYRFPVFLLNTCADSPNQRSVFLLVPFFGGVDGYGVYITISLQT
jgi:hypothetical protein